MSMSINGRIPGAVSGASAYSAQYSCRRRASLTAKVSRISPSCSGWNAGIPTGAAIDASRRRAANSCCGARISCPISVAPVAYAMVLAATMPARSPVNGAGPMPTTTVSRSRGCRPASATARAMLPWSRSTWVRESASMIGSRPTMPTADPYEVSITSVRVTSAMLPPAVACLTISLYNPPATRAVRRFGSGERANAAMPSDGCPSRLRTA